MAVRTSDNSFSMSWQRHVENDSEIWVLFFYRNFYTLINTTSKTGAESLMKYKKSSTVGLKNKRTEPDAEIFFFLEREYWKSQKARHKKIEQPSRWPLEGIPFQAENLCVIHKLLWNAFIIFFVYNYTKNDQIFLCSHPALSCFLLDGLFFLFLLFLAIAFTVHVGQLLEPGSPTVQMVKVLFIILCNKNK